MGRRRWKSLGMRATNDKIQAVEQALNQATAELEKPIMRVVEPLVRNPVEIYENGRWIIVDKTARDFPVQVKMKITPEWALQVVSERNNSNRNVRDDRVEKYIADILNDNWQIINNGIGFYEDGQLGDGQHRLWAVVEAQKPVEMFVLFGMKREALPVIDEGATRSTKDVAKLMDINATHSQLSITNYILEYKNLRRTMPRGEQIAFYNRHCEAVEFILSRLKRKGVTKAPLLAALMRAWYSVDRNKLARFLEILETGMVNNESEQSAIVLREFMLRNSNNSGPFRAEVYRKTEAALVNFIAGEVISRLYGLKEEQFLLPEEKIDPAMV
jgi:hypothetical protein